MSRRFRLAGAALATVLLAACTSAPVRPPAPAVDAAEAQARQQERQQRLEVIPAWSMQGRIAVSVGDKGGSGRLDWQQQGPAYRVSLGAPVTRQSWRLSGEPGGATLEGLEGGPYSGPDAEALLWQATGWPIPVEAMAWWVRGLPAPAGAGQEFGDDGRLRRLVADGWTVDYQEWQPAADGWPEMPRRLQASRDGARVRLVVDRWEAAP
ncbi:lipoprotein insertase outer membrane protein LolB [Pseudoxanthomonas suwonensis]|uniref:Outer-membrane lipoprotein LolB n=1 Tax=Pseudoxanthomonas suwonensis TaxID=314722 RepID=A0A0E3Z0G5_9GAMM|nr:lipoprotein insertase outer membrane protein LolB [Pseudoxanthomonas suwonensis]AKC86034.1 outer membrane lipoprotein LolB [Pseudoxanthomonas suwonensis]